MSGNSSVFRSIFRNVSLLTVGRILSALCSFVHTAFAVRALGLADFGLLILIHSLAMTGSTLSRLQTWQTLIRFGSDAFFNKDADRLNRVTSFCVRLDTMSAGAAFVFSLVAVQIYAGIAHWTPHTRLLATLYACVAPFMYTGWAQGVLRMASRFHYVPITEGLTALGKMIGVLLAYALHLSLGWFLLIWAASILFDHAFYSRVALSILKKRIGFRYLHAFRNWQWAGDGMWSFTRAVSANQTLGNASAPIATLLVGKGLGAAEAAVFRVCRQIASGIVTPAQLISPVLYPELVKMRDRQDWDGLKKVTLRIFAILTALSALLLFLTGTVGSKIFRYMLDVHVSHTSFYITIMLLAAIFSLLIVPLEPLLIVAGHLKLLVRSRILVTLLYFPAVYFLTLRFHLTGACLATAAASIAIFLTCLVGTRRFARKVRVLKKQAASGQPGADSPSDKAKATDKDRG
ncbi:lipopolysaccharide biosynthesis protein [Acetobacter estunensis]|uniref:lipopolysaccharide biosynthesis protein n=1 Tax=Acetobacter estunensis TaxID=104097 RepID=UPI001C2D3570|nr:lipopolysaccharide biosynthesis protein [Acetobacter estunensis]MBV1836163.1 lipopolysaccharide biosynthesis protein [Acetobacter estunensis]